MEIPSSPIRETLSAPHDTPVPSDPSSVGVETPEAHRMDAEHGFEGTAHRARRFSGSKMHTRDDNVAHRRVVVIGAGFAGVGMAIRLLGAGERDFVVLEKASDVG